MLYVPHNSEETRHAYNSKNNVSSENEVIVLMISDGNKWHYLAIKTLPALLRRITSNHYGDFFSLNYLHSYRIKDKLKEYENVSKDHDCCCILKPKKIIKY